MSTFIHGIGSAENIDSAGEIVSIKGLDISSLELDGCFNYEHKNDQPNQVVGKILKAKKIFSDKDCDDDHQLYFWNKCKVPYVYVMGELFDDYSDSAREIAARFRYDADHKSNERAVMNFSVEGSKISKNGIVVDRSIARKITITVLPANKVAVAEMVKIDAKKPNKNSIDELFKTENYVEIEVLAKDEVKFQYGASNTLSGTGPTSAPGLVGGTGMMASEKNIKKAELAIAKHPSARGTKLGITSSGKDVYSHGMIGEYDNFGHKDHSEAADFHRQAHSNTSDRGAQGHHSMKARLHDAAARTGELKAKKFSGKLPETHSSSPATSTGPVSVSGQNKLHDPQMSGNVKPTRLQRAEVNKPVFPGLPGKEMHSTPSGKGVKSGMGTSYMGAHIRHGRPDRAKEIGQEQLSGIKSQPKPNLPKSEEMNKALTAGSGLASPDKLVGGAALAPESLAGKKQNLSRPDKGFGAIIHKPGKTPGIGKVIRKSEMLQRAEAEYENWSKREQFEHFMQKRMPHITKGEIVAIGQAMLLNKSMQMEKALEKVSPTAFQHSYMVKAELKHPNYTLHHVKGVHKDDSFWSAKHYPQGHANHKQGVDPDPEHLGRHSSKKSAMDAINSHKTKMAHDLLDSRNKK